MELIPIENVRDAYITITEEWQCTCCGVYTKLKTRRKADKDDLPDFRNPVFWIFDVINLKSYRTNPKTDWQRHVCSKGHEWCVCPHCQKSKGNKRAARCPKCGKQPININKTKDRVR